MAEPDLFLLFTRRLNLLCLPPVEVLLVEASRDQRGHFNIIHHDTGFKADVLLSGSGPLHAWGLARAGSRDVNDEPPVIAPPEYVIVRKLEYFREGGSEKHLRDIRSILTISPGLIHEDEIEPLIAERGLQELWRRVKVQPGT